MLKKVRGGKVTTTIAYQNIIDNESPNLDTRLRYVSVTNLSETEINVIVNGGDMLPLDSNETLNLALDDLEVDTLVVVEEGSTVKYIGI